MFIEKIISSMEKRECLKCNDILSYIANSFKSKNKKSAMYCCKCGCKLEIIEIPQTELRCSICDEEVFTNWDYCPYCGGAK